MHTSRISVFILVLLFFAGWLPALESESTDALQAKIEREIASLRRRALNPGLSAQERLTTQQSIALWQQVLRSKGASEDENKLNKELEEILTKRLAKSDNRIMREVVARWYLYRDDPERAVKLLRDLDINPDTDISWSALMLYSYIRLGDYRKADKYFQHLGSLMKKRTALRLSTPILAQRVVAYRLYDPRPNKLISPGENLTFYIEIGGANFRQVGAQRYQCKLAFGVELRDKLQKPIYRNDEYGVYDPAYRGPVQDLHSVIYYRLPHNIPPGRYTLAIHCRDVFAKGVDAEDTVMIELIVGGQGGPILREPEERDDPDDSEDGKESKPAKTTRTEDTPQENPVKTGRELRYQQDTDAGNLLIE